VDSPLQGPAPDYGSGFSRAVEIITRERSILLVSGTASIDAQGATRFPGELLPQIDETHRILEALLTASGYSQEDVCRAMRYSANSSELNTTLPAWLGMPVDAQVCRDDLVFEVELDAVKSTSPCPDDNPH
jgi:enamine deaminase RidA (YjgF/YER057c/UK114 family)